MKINIEDMKDVDTAAETVEGKPHVINVGKTMAKHFVPNMTSYFDLDEDTKEYDRMEARTNLAMIGMLPLLDETGTQRSPQLPA